MCPMNNDYWRTFVRPNLAETITDVNIGMVKLPVYGSPKFDGFRAFKFNGVLYSRSFKPIPNPAVQEKFKDIPDGYDGELMVGNPWDDNVFGRTSSIVTGRDGRSAEAVKFYVFDNFFEPIRPYLDRLRSVDKRVRVTHVRLDGLEAILQYEMQMLTQGYEGIILRNPGAMYKFGRSTMTDQGIMKLKRFADYEGRVVGVEEMYRNKNEAKIDTQGYMDRGSKQEGLVPAGCLGTLLVDFQGQILRVSQGFTEAMRKELWDNPPIDKLARFKCPPGGKPVSQGGTGLRPPYVFTGFRSEIDV